MEGDLLGKSNEPQFISFQDFSPINRSGGAGQAQLDVSSPDHQQNFGNLGNDSTGIDMMQDLQGMPSIKNDGNFSVSQSSCHGNNKYLSIFFDFLIWTCFCSWSSEEFLDHRVLPKVFQCRNRRRCSANKAVDDSARPWQLSAVAYSTESRLVRTILGLRHAGVLHSHQWESRKLPADSKHWKVSLEIRFSSGVLRSDLHIPLCLAAASYSVGSA